MTNLLQNYANAEPDRQVYLDHIEISKLADADGYYSIGSVEHHFDPGYSMCPDNVQFLTYLAALTTQAKVHTTAVILPWNDPMRVVERIALLDTLSGGRAMFGMGRGLARREFEGFGVPMGESRDRVDEAAAMIMRGLEDGYVENDGKFFPQKRVPVHPAPLGSFKDRTTCVAMSPDSAIAAGKLGVPMMAFIQGDMATLHLPMISSYRETYREHHGGTPPPPLMIDLTYCHQDADTARQVASECIANYYMSCVEHYEFGDRHFESTTGYESYAAATAAIAEYGMEAIVDAYVNAQIWGTPEDILAKHRARKELVGEYEPIMVFQYGGLRGAQALDSYRLFTAEVLPALLAM
jgi:alkanesulfonate monooxygenase SsuD/methylene tetrahydromethanopterin reductase-like flavin-dependent oxidoreductase (luciferase family)